VATVAVGTSFSGTGPLIHMVNATSANTTNTIRKREVTAGSIMNFFAAGFSGLIST
jgi:hypothetical protein